ncbi:hypothetical protein Tco_1344177 [Tanacetum coccineum]
MSSIAESSIDLTVVEVKMTKRNPKIRVNYDLCVMSDNSRRTRMKKSCVAVKATTGSSETTLENDGSLWQYEADQVQDGMTKFVLQETLSFDHFDNLDNENEKQMNTRDDVGKGNKGASEQKEAGEEVMPEIEKEPVIEKPIRVGSEVAVSMEIVDILNEPEVQFEKNVNKKESDMQKVNGKEVNEKEVNDNEENDNVSQNEENDDGPRKEKQVEIENEI